MMYTVINIKFFFFRIEQFEAIEWTVNSQVKLSQVLVTKLSASKTRGGSFLLVGHLRGKEEESERVLGLLQPEL